MVYFNFLTPLYPMNGIFQSFPIKIFDKYNYLHSVESELKKLTFNISQTDEEELFLLKGKTKKFFEMMEFLNSQEHKKDVKVMRYEEQLEYKFKDKLLQLQITEPERRKREAKEKRRRMKEKHKKFLDRLNLDHVEEILSRLPGFDFSQTLGEIEKKLLNAGKSRLVFIQDFEYSRTLVCNLLTILAVDMIYMATLKLKNGEKYFSAGDLRSTGIKSLVIVESVEKAERAKFLFEKIKFEIKQRLEKKEAEVEDIILKAQDLIQIEDDVDLNNISFVPEIKEKFDEIGIKDLLELKEMNIEDLKTKLTKQNLANNGTRSILNGIINLKDYSTYPLILTRLEFYLLNDEKQGSNFFRNHKRKYLRKKVNREVQGHREFFMTKKYDEDYYELSYNISDFLLTEKIFEEEFYPFLMKESKKENLNFESWHPKILRFFMLNRYRDQKMPLSSKIMKKKNLLTKREIIFFNKSLKNFKKETGYFDHQDILYNISSDRYQLNLYFLFILDRNLSIPELFYFGRFDTKRTMINYSKIETIKFKEFLGIEFKILEKIFRKHYGFGENGNDISYLDNLNQKFDTKKMIECALLDGMDQDDHVVVDERVLVLNGSSEENLINELMETYRTQDEQELKLILQRGNLLKIGENPKNFDILKNINDLHLDEAVNFQLGDVYLLGDFTNLSKILSENEKKSETEFLNIIHLLSHFSLEYHNLILLDTSQGQNLRKILLRKRKKESNQTLTPLQKSKGESILYEQAIFLLRNEILDEALEIFSRFGEANLGMRLTQACMMLKEAKTLENNTIKEASFKAQNEIKSFVRGEYEKIYTMVKKAKEIFFDANKVDESIICCQFLKDEETLEKVLMNEKVTLYKANLLFKKGDFHRAGKAFLKYGLKEKAIISFQKSPKITMKEAEILMNYLFFKLHISETAYSSEKRYQIEEQYSEFYTRYLEAFENSLIFNENQTNRENLTGVEMAKIILKQGLLEVESNYDENYLKNVEEIEKIPSLENRMFEYYMETGEDEFFKNSIENLPSKSTEVKEVKIDKNDVSLLIKFSKYYPFLGNIIRDDEILQKAKSAKIDQFNPNSLEFFSEILLHFGYSHLLNAIVSTFQLEFRTGKIAEFISNSRLWKMRGIPSNFYFKNFKFNHSLRIIDRYYVEDVSTKMNIELKGDKFLKLHARNLPIFGFYGHLCGLKQGQFAKQILTTLKDEELLTMMTLKNQKEFKKYLKKTRLDRLNYTFETFKSNNSIIPSSLFRYNLGGFWTIKKQDSSHLSKIIENSKFYGKLVCSWFRINNINDYDSRTIYTTIKMEIEVLSQMLIEEMKLRHGDSAEAYEAGFTLATLQHIFISFKAPFSNFVDYFNKNIWEKTAKKLMDKFMKKILLKLFKEFGRLFKVPYLTKRRFEFLKGYLGANLVTVLEPVVYNDLDLTDFFLLRRALVHRGSWIFNQSSFQASDFYIFDSGCEFLTIGLNDVVRELVFERLEHVFELLEIKEGMKGEEESEEKKAEKEEEKKMRIASLLSNLRKGKSELDELTVVDDIDIEHDDRARGRIEALERKIKNIKKKLKIISGVKDKDDPLNSSEFPFPQVNFLKSSGLYQTFFNELTDILGRFKPIEGGRTSEFDENSLYKFWKICVQVERLDIFHKLLRDLKAMKKSDGNLFQAKQIIEKTQNEEISENQDSSKEKETESKEKETPQEDDPKLKEKKSKNFNSLKSDAFLLIDSEMSLLSGNTEEFYHEALDFIKKNIQKAKPQLTLSLLFKTSLIAILANTEEEDAIYLDELCLRIINSYSEKISLKNIKLNRIESDPDFTKIHECLEEIESKTYIDYDDSLFAHVNDLLTLNGYSKNTNEMGEVDNAIEEWNLELKTHDSIRDVWKEYDTLRGDNDPDVNFEEYEQLGKDLLKKRARFENLIQNLRARKSWLRKFLMKVSPQIENCNYDLFLSYDMWKNPRLIKAFKGGNEYLSHAYNTIESIYKQLYLVKINEPDFILKKALKVMKKLYRYVEKFSSGEMVWSEMNEDERLKINKEFMSLAERGFLNIDDFKAAERNGAFSSEKNFYHFQIETLKAIVKDN